MLLFFYSYLILSVVHFSMLLSERLLLLMSFVFSKELSDFFFKKMVVVHSMASRCQCFSICGDCKEVEVQQRLLHCLNQGTGSGSTALLAVIPSSSLPPTRRTRSVVRHGEHGKPPLRFQPHVKTPVRILYGHRRFRWILKSLFHVWKHTSV